MKSMPNTVSLLPSLTEIVCALGMGHTLSGRSHECDYPPSVKDLPVCTEPKFEADGTSYEIDRRVKALLQEGLSVYRVDGEQLKSLNPDIILTQDHCEVCAAPLSEVEKAVRQSLNTDVKIISVSPLNLNDVLNSIHTVASALGVSQRGEELVQNMQQQFEEISSAAKAYSSKEVLCLEWLSPLMTAGNWVPELIEIAGGIPSGAEAGSHSPFADWETILKLDADIILIMPCGYTINKTQKEIHTLQSDERWRKLRAVRENQVYILEGNQYFNRPGPRLTDSARILAEILYPGLFEDTFRGRGWIKFNNSTDINSIENE